PQTSATSCRARSDGTAISGVPKKTARNRAALGVGSIDGGHSLPARRTPPGKGRPGQALSVAPPIQAASRRATEKIEVLAGLSRGWLSLPLAWLACPSCSRNGHHVPDSHPS